MASRPMSTRRPRLPGRSGRIAATTLYRLAEGRLDGRRRREGLSNNAIISPNQQSPSIDRARALSRNRRRAARLSARPGRRRAASRDTERHVRPKPAGRRGQNAHGGSLGVLLGPGVVRRRYSRLGGRPRHRAETSREPVAFHDRGIDGIQESSSHVEIAGSLDGLAA